MTNSQYLNIIKYSAYMEHEAGNIDYFSVARNILKKLGVAFPTGSYEEAINAMKNNCFLGWRACSKDEAQKYANVGVTAIAINAGKIIIIRPDQNTDDLLGTIFVDIDNHPCIKHTTQLNDSQNAYTMYYAYSYGHIYW